MRIGKNDRKRWKGKMEWRKRKGCGRKIQKRMWKKRSFVGEKIRKVTGRLKTGENKGTKET